MSQIQDLRARYNAGGNAVIPNTFQHPNIFIDKLMYFLSPIENVVLTFAVRRILGFQSNIMSRRDNISLSQFTDGIMAEDGHALSLGCGIGLESCVKALDALCLFKILIPTTEKPDPKKGQEYWLQDNENAIDWAGLEKRKSEKTEKYRLQTQKARYSVEQNPRGDVEQNPSPLLNRDTKPTETHTNTQVQEHAPDGAKVEVPPNYGMDWQIAGNAQHIHIPDEIEIFKANAASFAYLIAANNADLEPLAYQFMISANKIPAEKDIKLWRKAFRGYTTNSTRSVTPEDIRLAVEMHIEKKLSIKSPLSIEWALTEVITPTPQATQNSEPKAFAGIRQFLEAQNVNAS